MTLTGSRSTDAADLVMPLACEMPRWLRQWQPGHRMNLADFWASRVVFYPGSGSDGQPVHFFGSRHLAHCFVYVDYGLSKTFLEQELGPRGHPFAGYDSFDRVHLNVKDLKPSGLISHVPQPPVLPRSQEELAQFVFLEILQRRHGLDNSHGPERLAILFLCADGVAAYDAIFGQAQSQPLFALVLQDHGFGGNWTTFGRGGALEQVAMATSRYPQVLLVAENTHAWNGYSPIDGTISQQGGMHGFRRQAWLRTAPIQVTVYSLSGHVSETLDPLHKRRNHKPMATHRSSRNTPLSVEAEASASDQFFNSLHYDAAAQTLVSRLRELCDTHNVRIHHTYTAGGDLRVEADRPAPAPLRRNVITMIWRPRKGLFACQSLLSVAQCVAAGMAADCVRGNNGVLHSHLNVLPGFHDDAFLAVVEASIRLFREQ